MNNKQVEEVRFWQGLYDSDELEQIRAKDKIEKTKFFKIKKGQGLDLGCGIYSIFDRDAIAVDPLMNYYKDIVKIDYPIPHLEMDGENLEFEDDTFDWVFCVNVIDHTPNPEMLISEIRRVLKKGGELYFSVNFDDNLSAAHYDLWDINKVRYYLRKFKLKREQSVRNDKDFQTIYEGVYI